MGGGGGGGEGLGRKTYLRKDREIYREGGGGMRGGKRGSERETGGGEWK